MKQMNGQTAVRVKKAAKNKNTPWPTSANRLTLHGADLSGHLQTITQQTMPTDPHANARQRPQKLTPIYLADNTVPLYRTCSSAIVFELAKT